MMPRERKRSSPLCDVALLFCPYEFRREYRDQIQLEVAEGRPLLAAAADLAFTGICMHAEQFRRDLLFALRILWKAPLFSIVGVMAIALAIGANVAVASVLGGVLFMPLPYAHSDRLVFVGEDAPIRSASYPDERILERDTRVFSALGAARADRKTLTGAGPAQTILGSVVSPGYFGVFALKPLLGRVFSNKDAGAAVAIISERLWLGAFAGDAHIVGRQVRLDGRSYTIVGVAPAGFIEATSFGLMYPPDFWLPIDPRSMYATPRALNYTLAGRLNGFVSVAAARADVSRVVAQIVRAYPRYHAAIVRHPAVQRMLDSVTAPVWVLLWLAYAAVAAVLIIACANVANLSLVRFTGRQNEFAVRAALGASSGRIIMQMSTEAGLLALLGTIIGVAVGWAGLHAFAAFGPSVLPRWESVAIDPTILVYVVLLMIFTTLTTGVMPALLYRRNIGTTLRAAGRSGKSVMGGVRAVLVVAEIALALVIVVSAGLVVRSFVTLTHADLGFDPANTYVVSNLGFTGPRYLSYTAQAGVARQIRAKLHAVAGVTDVAAAGTVPFVYRSTSTFSVPGTKIEGNANFSAVDQEFFSALRIPILRGRPFGSRDRSTSQSVTVVSATFARTYFGTLDVIGKRIVPQTIASTGTGIVVRTIIGVVADTRRSFSAPFEPTMYFPVAQFPSFWQVVVRTNDRADIGNGVAAAFRAIDPLLPRPTITSYKTLLARDVLRSQASTVLFTTLGGIALALALAGIYAVCSFTVEERTHEFGIRKAIGAADGSIVTNVLGTAARQSTVGVIAGLAVAAVVTQFLADLLFQTSPLDAFTFGAAILLVVACMLSAALVPALRASRTDPGVALRYE